MRLDLEDRPVYMAEPAPLEQLVKQEILVILAQLEEQVPPVEPAKLDPKVMQVLKGSLV